MVRPFTYLFYLLGLPLVYIENYTWSSYIYSKWIHLSESNSIFLPIYLFLHLLLLWYYLLYVAVCYLDSSQCVYGTHVYYIIMTHPCSRINSTKNRRRIRKQVMFTATNNILKLHDNTTTITSNNQHMYVLEN